MLLLWLTLLASCILYYLFHFYKNVLPRYPPGPKPYPILGNLLQLSPINLHKCFETYARHFGPIFTVFLPEPTVILTDLSSIKDALVRNADAFSGRPNTPQMYLFQTTGNGGVIAADGASWRDHRRFAIQTLKNFGMGKNVMEHKVVASINTLKEHLDGIIDEKSSMDNKAEKKLETVMDMQWPIALCVGNVNNELLLGYHWKPNDCQKYMDLINRIDTTVRQFRARKISLLVNAWPWLRFVPILGWYGYRQMRGSYLNLMEHIMQEVRDHKAKMDLDSLTTEDATDMIGAYLIEMEKRKKSGNLGYFSELNLANLITDFWMAGLETTATTLRWAILFLVSHPEIQKRLQEEIDSVIGTKRNPTMADKSQMPYTNAFIMELQRRANIITFNIPHRTLTDVTVNGQTIPKDTTVFPQIISVMDSPVEFFEPDRFEPERFLEEDGVTFDKQKMDYLVPFSLGKRQCAAEALAKMELFLITVSLVQHYSFTVPDNGRLPDLTPIYGATQVPMPYECLVKRRSG